VDVVSTPTVLPDGKIRPPHLKLRTADKLAAPFGVDPSWTDPEADTDPIACLRDAVGVISAGFTRPI
jgi:hypothetical protein